jgi:MioC protein
MSTSVRILVGTTTGNTQYVAEEAQYHLRQAGVTAEVLPMDDLDASIFANGGLYLVCVSTYGYGDVPANAKKLYESMITGRPDLSAVVYGLISLGDSSHAQTYCFGGRRFDQLLTKLGARRIGETLEHDASSGVMPEEAAAAWISPWLAAVHAQQTVAA